MRSSHFPHLVRHNNGYIYIHWTDPTPRGQRGRSRTETTGHADPAQAEIIFGQWLLDRRNVKPADEKTVTSLWDAYHQGHILAGKVTTDRGQRCWQNLEPHFGALPLSKVTSAVVRQYVTKRTRGEIGRPSQPQTIRRELVILVAALRWCAHSGRKLVNSASVPFIELPPDSEPRDRWLTTDEIKRLFDVAAESRRGDTAKLSRCERFLWLALETAARKQAIYDLTWDRVDFETNVIHFDVPGRRKTKKRRSNVPISAALRPVLERMRRESESHLVMVLSGEVLPLLSRTAKRAGLEGVSPHVLRHTAATHMARRGVPLWKIAKILGNSVAMVERVYAKHCADDLREAVDTITGGAVEMRH